MRLETTENKAIKPGPEDDLHSEKKVCNTSGSSSGRKSSADKKDNEDGSESSLCADTSRPVCRICFRGANEDCGPLVAPCICKGSMGLTHKACIERWLRVRNTDQCNVCLVVMNVRRTKAPLHKFFGDPDHRKDVIRMAINLMACSCDVLILALAWTYAADYLARQGWLLYTLILAALIFQTLFWLLVELVRAWTCYVPLRTWRNKNVLVELVLDGDAEATTGAASLRGRAIEKAGQQTRPAVSTPQLCTVVAPARVSLSLPSHMNSE